MVVSEEECVVVKIVFVGVLLKVFLSEVVILYEDDEVMCFIIDDYDV